MAWGKSNEQWNHTASLMGLLAQINADTSSGKAPTAYTFHPYLDEPAEFVDSQPATAAFLKSIGFREVTRKAGDP
jgi:hypothetical protein